MRLALLISLPAAVALALLAEPMLSTLFQYRAFDERDVVMAGRSLVAYSTGLSAFILVKILAPGFYAKQDTRTPVRIGIIAMCSNVVLNLVLVFPFAHAGLALATSLAAFLNAGLLLRALLANGSYAPVPGWTSYIVKLVVATAVMGTVISILTADQAIWSAAEVGDRARMLSVLIAAGTATYFISVFGFGLRIRDFVRDTTSQQ
jgi:putative peptidoglycan lipid II flippase